MSPTYRWQIFPANPTLSERLATELGISAITAQILLNRNIRSLRQAQEFLNPDLLWETSKTLDWPAMAEAVVTIQAIVDAKAPVFLYADYDVDGATSLAMMLSFFKANSVPVGYRIPHRQRDGYGVHAPYMDEIAQAQPTLLITLDCGITNGPELLHFRSACPHAKVMIFDHHLLPETLPPADIIVNPKCLPPDHPAYGLCTAGLIHTFLTVYHHRMGISWDDSQTVDLAALGTIADVAPLTHFNRSLTQRGLLSLSQRKRPGIRHLLNAADLTHHQLTVRDVGFSLAPRLNAAGRLSHAKWAVETLVAEEDHAAQSLALRLNRLNEDRRTLCQHHLDEAVAWLKAHPEALDAPAIAVPGAGWHAGVVGIVASQLCQQYQKPAVVIAHDAETGRASARTFGTVDIHAVLAQCDSHFLHFGGHRQAAGFAIQTDRIPLFLTAFREAASAAIHPDDLTHTLDIDASVSPDILTEQLAAEMTTLGPFGQGNPMPVLMTEGLRVIESRTVGQGRHLKARFTDASGRIIVDGIGFGLADKINALYAAQPKLAFGLEMNHWNGQKTLQLQLLDIL